MCVKKVLCALQTCFSTPLLPPQPVRALSPPELVALLLPAAPKFSLSLSRTRLMSCSIFLPAHPRPSCVSPSLPACLCCLFPTASSPQTPNSPVCGVRAAAGVSQWCCRPAHGLLAPCFESGQRQPPGASCRAVLAGYLYTNALAALAAYKHDNKTLCEAGTWAF